MQRLYWARVGLPLRVMQWRGISRETISALSEPESDEEEDVKKIGFLTLLIVATILFMIAFPAAAAGPKAPAPPVPAVAATPMPEPHPEIRDALEAMRNAKHHLESAAHDYDGHRVKAIEHLDRAIHEAEICMSMN